jgi:hypothetical protein
MQAIALATLLPEDHRKVGKKPQQQHTISSLEYFSHSLTGLSGVATVIVAKVGSKSTAGEARPNKINLTPASAFKSVHTLHGPSKSAARAETAVDASTIHYHLCHSLHNQEEYNRISRARHFQCQLGLYLQTRTAQRGFHHIFLKRELSPF